MAQIPNAAAIIAGQLFQVRAGALAPGTSTRERRLIIVRMLFYNQFYVLGWLLLWWWVDLLPWIGGSRSLGEWLAGVRLTLECSVGGPSAVSAPESVASCPPLTPLWTVLFIFSYITLLVAQAAISAESAVFNTAVLLLSGCAVSLFFLLPGVNPDASNTPPWSVIAALVLSTAGVILWKRWELTIPLAEQFDVRSIREEIGEEEEEEENSQKHLEEGPHETTAERGEFEDSKAPLLG